VHPETLIDINGIEKFNGINEDENGGLLLG
jgi:CO/xanthine dehydrogenase FAD-binding subunit